MSFIKTYTGKKFDPMNPDPEKIDIRDIAHALSFTCRGNGQVKTYFSVAQHCINCCKEANARGFSDRIALACLVHDATESYMSDVPRPFKQFLTSYIDMEEKMLDIIYEKFLGQTLTEEEKKIVKQIDDDMLYFDLVDLLDFDNGQEKPKINIDIDYTFVPFEEVENEYLDLYNQFKKV